MNISQYQIGCHYELALIWFSFSAKGSRWSPESYSAFVALSHLPRSNSLWYRFYFFISLMNFTIIEILFRALGRKKRRNNVTGNLMRICRYFQDTIYFLSVTKPIIFAFSSGHAAAHRPPLHLPSPRMPLPAARIAALLIDCLSLWWWELMPLFCHMPTSASRFDW